jgi:Phosphotransferase enzyme family
VIWTDPGWLAEATAWIGAHADVTGEIEQPHVRPWSTVMRVPTAGGVLWFKACMPLLAHEPALLEVLAARRPHAVPELVAVDKRRGWMLQRDAGTRLRELVQGEALVEVWRELLPFHAELQIDVAADCDALLAAGAPDRRLALVPGQYEGLVADDAIAPALGGEEARTAQALVPRVAELCGELAALGVPETIQHDDLHDGNVFVRDGRYLFFDWGDACVSHPFFTLVVTLGSVRYGLDLAEGAPELDLLRDAYLEPWGRFAPLPELRRVFPDAYRLGMVGLALKWNLLAPNLPAPWDDEYAGAAVERLRMFLAAA